MTGMSGMTGTTGFRALPVEDCVRFDRCMTTARPSNDVASVEARSWIDTAEGRLDVVARSRGERWWVSVSCGSASADAIATETGTALLAALELCGIEVQECGA